RARAATRHTLSLHDALPIFKNTERGADDVRNELDDVTATKIQLEKTKKSLEEELAQTRAQLEEEKSGKEAASSKAKQLGQQLEEDRKSTRLNSSHVKISYAV